MTEQFSRPDQEPSLGMQFLETLGLSGIADREFTTRSGATFYGRDFVDHCGPDAQAMVVGIQAFPEGAQKEQFVALYRQSLMSHLGIQVEQI